MAIIDIKELFADVLLELCKNTPLQSVTIKKMLDHTGASRQSFYNHFRDKESLIHYIYLERVIVSWKTATADFDYYSSIVDCFTRYVQYHYFMKQACMITGQNCLRDFMISYCKKFDLEMHQIHYGKEPMPDNLRFASEYHSIAAMSMTITWILSDMPTSPEEMAANITKMRHAGLSKLLYDATQRDDIYAQGIEKMTKSRQA